MTVIVSANPHSPGRLSTARGTMIVMQQRIDRLRLSDGTSVSYAVAGSGPPLVYLPGWVSHVELGWALPVERRFYESLATGRTLIRYDRPGCGLSDPAPKEDLVELEMDVLAALFTALGLQHADLLGTSLSAPLAVHWAAQRPETVGRLVLYGGWVRGARDPGRESLPLCQWNGPVLLAVDDQRGRG